jgi:hypothetical protein
VRNILSRTQEVDARVTGIFFLDPVAIVTMLFMTFVAWSTM